MKEPKILETVLETATYLLPTYYVSDEGIKDGDGVEVRFCKGDKSNSETFRQEGVFTESLLQVCKQYLESVNKGDLASRETSMAITKIDEALLWIGKRAEDRRLRGVQATYKK
jgi:hypothetical protein